MADRQPSVIVKDLYKSFRLPHEQHSGVKQLLVNIFKRKRGYETQHVLGNVSFEIEQGEFFGIVGRNGSGKSTLLKLLAGIYAPNKGLVQINGSLTPFIELGVGFNPELTGRENIFMNGALLGFSKKEMEAMYDDIVEFAELSNFMDQKLKNYSSGMQVRLAFSIAINSKSDTLIFDEVLAVGDENFQKKCIAVFEDYKARKQTIILVTHDMETVKRFCSRAMLIDKGSIVDIGSPTKIANTYTKLNERQTAKNIAVENDLRQKGHITKLTIEGENIVSTGGVISLHVSWPSEYRDRVKNVGVAIYKNSGEYILGANTVVDDFTINDNEVLYKAKLDLGGGSYHFKTALFGKSDTDVIEMVDKGPVFTVKQSQDERWEGIVNLKHEWSENV